MKNHSLTQTDTPPSLSSSTVYAKLSSGRFWALPATLGVIAFYLLCLLALVWIGFLFLLNLVVFVCLLRFGMTGWITPSIVALGQLLVVLARNLSLSPSVDYSLPLSREDAPRIFEMIEELTRRAGVRQPHEVVLEMDKGAWVQMRGYSAQGRSRLGFGYDLLAILTPEEFRAVLAHEIAHAKLVQRGYRGWLLNGLSRIVKQYHAMDDLVQAAKHSGTRFTTAKVLAQLTEKLGQLVSRLAAEYSRRDEFAADRMGAQLTSSEAARSALFQTYISDYGEDFTWRQRLAQIEQADGLAGWLRERLLPQDETIRRRLEQRALKIKQSSEFDTHPPLAERVAALEQVGHDAEYSGNALTGIASGSEARWASDLLRDPDGIALKLLQKIESVAHREEQRHSREAARWVKRHHRKSGSRMGAIILMLLSGGLAATFFGYAVATRDAKFISEMAMVFVILLGAFGLGFYLYSQTPGYKETIPLPIPPFGEIDLYFQNEANKNEQNWQAAYESPTADASINEHEDQEYSDKLTALRQTRTGGDKRSLRAYWSEQAYSALHKCDYDHAGLAARLCLENDPKCLEGLLANSISRAAQGDENSLQQPLGEIIYHVGLRQSLNWASAWSLCLLGYWSGAEPYLLDATRRQEGASTLFALLAMSQWDMNKMGEAIANARRAVELAPQDTSTRVLLLRLLLDAGHVREAKTLLEELRVAAPDHREVYFAKLNWLCLRKDEAALAYAQELTAAHNHIRDRLKIARLLAEAKFNDAAREYYRRACDGVLCPEASIALSKFEYDEENLPEARRLLLETFDIEQPAYPSRLAQLHWFSSAFEGLNQINNAMQTGSIHEQPCDVKCQAWLADLDFGNRLARVNTNRLELLLVYPEEALAQQQANEILNAIFPQESAAPQFTLKFAEADLQPKMNVIPGIRGHRWL